MPKYIVASLDMPICQWAKYEISYYIAKAKANNQTILPILIDSPGGDVYAMRSIQDMLTASGLKIAVIASGKVMSAAIPIYAMAERGMKFSFPRASFMIHEAKRFAGMDMMQKGSDLKSSAKEAERLTNDMYALLDKQCGKQSGYFQKLVYDQGNSDLFLSAEDAKQHGLVDEIKIPSFVDIFGSVENTPQINNNDDMEDMIMTLAMESSQPLREKRKQFFELSENGSQEILEQKISAFFNENNSNFNLKQEEIYEMSKPNLDGQTPPNAGVEMISMSDVQAKIDEALRARETALKAEHQNELSRVKTEAYKEVETKLSGVYESKFNTLNEKLSALEVKANESQAEAEKMRVEKKLLDLKDKSIISQQEVEAELKWIMEFTVEGAARDSYLDKLSNKTPNPLFKKSANLPDSEAVMLTEDERGIIEKFPNKAAEVMAEARIRHNITVVKKLPYTPENIRKERKEMAAR